MTNEALLQQAKDQVARDNGYNYPDGKNWYRFTFRIPSKRLEEACDEAAKRAIQRAREEGAKEERSKQPWKGSMNQDKN